jgi:predicted RNase H-like HicB family nuclease
MTIHYPVVLEREESGAVSAYVPGLPVYAAADTHAKAERAIRGVLRAYLDAHPGSRSGAQVRVARVDAGRAGKVDIVGVAALVGARQSAANAQASRANGRLGRPGRAAKARRTKAVRLTWVVALRFPDTYG